MKGVFVQCRPLAQRATKLNREELIQLLSQGDHRLTSQIFELTRVNVNFEEVIEDYLIVADALDHWTAKSGPQSIQARQYRALVDDRMEELHKVLRRSGITVKAIDD